MDTDIKSLIIAAVGSIVGLLATNALITNDTGKLVTGLASALVPLGFAIYAAVHHNAKAKIAAAREFGAAAQSAGTAATLPHV